MSELDELGPEWCSAELDEIAPALIAASAEISNLVADSEGQVGESRKYKYAALPQLLDLIRPILHWHDLGQLQLPISSGTRVGCTTVIWHKSGQWIRSRLDFETRPGPQPGGSSLTYARRYSLAALLGIATHEDDDGAAAQPDDALPAQDSTELGNFEGWADEPLGFGQFADQTWRAIVDGSWFGRRHKYLRFLVTQQARNPTGAVRLAKAQAALSERERRYAAETQDADPAWEGAAADKGGEAPPLPLGDSESRPDDEQ